MFDPYLQWFKIPADRRPPNYYELLDLSPADADDPVAIHNAAERRSDQLLRHTSGPHAEECVRIAKEIDQACQTLLDPALRRKYDERPGQRTSAKAKRAGPTAKPAPAAEPKPAAAADEDIAEVLPVAAENSSTKKVALVVGGSVLLILIGGVLAYFFSPPKKKSAPPPPVAAAPAPAPIAVPVPVAVPPTTPPTPAPEPKKEEPVTLVTAPPAIPPPAPTIPKLPPEPKEIKQAVPDEPEQEKARREIKATYKKEYESLKNSDDYLALSAKFLQPGRENRQDPAAWYVLLTEARDLAVRAERPRLAIEAINEIDKHFTIEPQAMALSALTTIGHPAKQDLSSLRFDARLKTFVSVAMGRITAAEKADNYRVALELLALVDEVLTRFKADKTMLTRLAEKRGEVLKYQSDYQAVATAEEQLKQGSEDPAANLVVGHHLACDCGKWDEGLPLLARGSDPAIRDIAKADVERPADSKSQMAIADFWWNYGRQSGMRSAAEVQLHAAYWYDKALALFLDGADRARAIDRIEEAWRLRTNLGTRLTPGTVQGRNVEDRALLLREGGGTMQSEDAVERGLTWIAAHQSLDGAWRTDAFAYRCSCPDPGKKHDIAGTAFGLLPLLGAGNTYKQGKYRASVTAGLNFLMLKQARDGSFVTTTPYGPYENALATLALSEAYGMGHTYCLDAAMRAVNYIVKTQSPFGGWGYEPRSMSPDTSVTLWQILALKTAVHAGIYVPKDAFDPMDNFLDRVVDKNGPGYWYKPPGRNSSETGPRPSLLPDGILCRELLDWKQDTRGLARSAREVAHMTVAGIKDRPAIYFLFFSRQALHHFGGKEWEVWNSKTRDILVSLQDKGDEFAREHRTGSWSPINEQWMEEGGRLMSTSLAVMGLEVYYSTVPLNGFGPAVLNE